MLSEIFYQKCLGCGLNTEGCGPICPDCAENLEAHPHACESCGYPSPIPLKICGMCSQRGDMDRIHIAYKYRGAVKALIRDIKFNYRISGRQYLNSLIDTESIKGYDTVTCVPSHFTRKIRRISHPAQMMAKHIAASTDAQYKTLLKRIRRTEYQFKLKKIQRTVNVKGAFMCTFDVTGLKILLVDDIITTGSTVKECCRILKKAGAEKVDVFALTGGSSDRS